MFHQPDHQHNLSLRLSQVLDEIGVNQEIVTKRRSAWMLKETIDHIDSNLTFCKSCKSFKSFRYVFGSQTEGSTTVGLQSDMDILKCRSEFSVIQDWSEWQQGKEQYLMIQDDTTSPGYCLLQALYCYVHVHEHHSIDNSGRVLLKHSRCLDYIQDGQIRHGPAVSVHNPNEQERDIVSALHCLSWPKEANPWLEQRSTSGWPTEDMKRYSAEQGCFLVPVCSRTGIYQDVEWRISTSFAERCLMWSLNITQIRCYILMKMILKTFLKPKCGEAVSSFMCKSILFHCIADSDGSSLWNESTLLSWLNQCLQFLFNCILTENCPHFIIPRNNLLAGKLSADIKHQLADVMCMLTGNIEQSLLGISIDKLGSRLHVKSGGLSVVDLECACYIAASVAFINIRYLSELVLQFIQKILDSTSHHNVPICYNYLSGILLKLCQLYCIGGRLEKAAISLFTPFLCTNIGSILASVDIQHCQGISHAALLWYSFGLNSDISSSRLKLASALYCAGDLERCEFILGTLERKLSQSAVSYQCHCCSQQITYTYRLARICYEIYEKAIQNNLSLCVKYSPCEINCIPEELKYEMFRSTEDDRPYRGKRDHWMDCAVVDSLPFLHFLRYKVYSRLQRPDDKVRALNNLAHAISTEDNLGHKETAFNLLGQCMEQENQMQDALFCYGMSLNVRGRNNAAKWLVCMLLARQFRG